MGWGVVEEQLPIEYLLLSKIWIHTLFFFSFVAATSSLNALKVDTHLLIELTFMCRVDDCSDEKFIWSFSYAG